jgi:hypothetical protein
MNTVNTFIQTILSLLGQPAQQPTLTQVLLAEQNNNGLIVQLGAADQLILTALSNIQTRLSNQIGSPQQTGQPVTLPTTPPAGYGGASAAASAAAVWSYLMDDGRVARNHMTAAGTFATRLGELPGVLFPSRYHPLVLQRSFWDSFTNDAVDGSDLVALDTSQIHLYNSAGEWAFGLLPTYHWTLDPTGYWFGDKIGSSEDADWMINLTQAEFDMLKRQQLSLDAAPPVWPGIGHVTLGAPLALADGLNVPGPLDGVLVHISSVSYPISFYPFGTLKSFVKVGGIVFVDDNGQGEMAQPLGLEQDVVCPRTMVQADHALLRLQTGVVGTITPWVRS